MGRLASASVSVLVGALVLGIPAMAAGSGAPGGATPIAITVQAGNVDGDAVGTFTLIGAVSDSGKSHVIGNTSSAKPVLGQKLYTGRSRGPGELDGRKGHLSITWSGSFFPVNRTTLVTTGSWRIRGGTGIYTTWQGSGSFVSVGRDGSFEARFDGLVTR